MRVAAEFGTEAEQSVGAVDPIDSVERFAEGASFANSSQRSGVGQHEVAREVLLQGVFAGFVNLYLRRMIDKLTEESFDHSGLSRRLNEGLGVSEDGSEGGQKRRHYPKIPDYITFTTIFIFRTTKKIDTWKF